MAYTFKDASGASQQAASDTVGSAIVPTFKIDAGAAGASAPVSAAAPLPVREPVKGSALGKGGITAATTTGQVVASNGARTLVEVSNGGTSGVWLAFGSSAVAGQGTYLPAKATGYWPTTAAVACILEAGGTGGPVGYTEW